MADTEEKLGLLHLLPSTILTIIMLIKGKIGTTVVPWWMFLAVWAVACVPFFLVYYLRRENLSDVIAGLDDPKMRFFMLSGVESGYFFFIAGDVMGISTDEGSYLQAAFLVGLFALTAAHCWIHKKL